MKITKRWIKKWKPCKEVVDWIQEQGTRDVFELIERLRKSGIKEKYDWLYWAIPRLLKTKKDKIKLISYCVEFIALPIIEEGYLGDGCYQKMTKGVKDVIVRHAIWSIIEMTEAVYGATAKKNNTWVTVAVSRAIATIAIAITKAEKYIDIRKDAIVDYGVKLLKGEADEIYL